MDTSYPSLIEAMGLHPIGERLRQTLVVLRGAEDVPPSRFDASSLGMLRPSMAIPLWWGRFYRPRTVLLTCLYNHRQTPIEDGWSVRRTQMQDFRGGELTYDSHNGTDLSVPRGTLAVAPAAGVVTRVFAEFNRGGLKVVIDHGDGLITSSAHLARALVQEGDVLTTGQPYAITGYSGLDGVSTFPLGVPHIHFNVWFEGQAVDPFAQGNAESLWRDGWPTPVALPLSHEQPLEADYDEARVDAIIAACLSASVRERLAAISPLPRRAAYLIAEMNYYPTRFPEQTGIYRKPHVRRPRINLPFLARDFDGVVFADEL